MNTPHFSWKNSEIDTSTALRFIKDLSQKEVPIVDINTEKQVVNDIFYHDTGCFIVKGLYSTDVMQRFNRWTEDMLEDAQKDINSRHPIQKDKILVNDLLNRMSATDPQLLLDILNKNELYHFSDILLGFTFIGSATAHYTLPNSNRQETHVDYPLHLNSSTFWGKDIEKMRRFTTKYQAEYILPRHSIQILIAPQKMDVSNGSTEVIPCSQRIPDIDLKVHDPVIRQELENRFKNVELDTGDVLFFNRRMVHRGGANISSDPRNSLILQCVHLWAIPQESYDYEKVKKSLFIHDITIPDDFLLRLKQPYSKEVKNGA